MPLGRLARWVVTRALTRLVAVSVAGTCTAGCKGDRPKAGARESSTATSPALTLEDYCKDAPCLRYEDALAKLEELAKPGSGCVTADTGACGEFRFLTYSSGFIGNTQYFAAAGAMIGAHFWSDTGERQDIGVIPSCKQVVERRLCGALDAGR